MGFLGGFFWVGFFGWGFLVGFFWVGFLGGFLLLPTLPAGWPAPPLGSLQPGSGLQAALPCSPLPQPIMMQTKNIYLFPPNADKKRLWF